MMMIKNNGIFKKILTLSQVYSCTQNHGWFLCTGAREGSYPTPFVILNYFSIRILLKGYSDYKNM